MRRQLHFVAAVGLVMIPSVTAAQPLSQRPPRENVNRVAQAPIDLVVTPAEPLSVNVRYRYADGYPYTGEQLQWMRGDFINKLKAAKNDEDFQDLLQQMQTGLENYFDHDSAARDKAIAGIESRHKNLLMQLERRKKAKDEIIALQLKIMEYDAKGLGYFSQSNESSTAGHNDEGPQAGVPMLSKIASPHRSFATQLNDPYKRLFVTSGANQVFLLPDSENKGWSRQRIQRTMRSWNQSLKNAGNDEDFAAALNAVKEAMNEYFDADVAQRQLAIDRIDDRTKKLRDQLAKRKAAKDEIIRLQLQVIENEAKGLGFFASTVNSGDPDAVQASRSAFPYYSTRGPRNFQLRTREYDDQQEILAKTKQWATRLRANVPAGKSKTEVSRWIDTTFPQLEPAQAPTSEIDQKVGSLGVTTANVMMADVKSTLRLTESQENGERVSVYFLFDASEELLGHYLVSYREFAGPRPSQESSSFRAAGDTLPKSPIQNEGFYRSSRDGADSDTQGSAVREDWKRRVSEHAPVGAPREKILEYLRSQKLKPTEVAIGELDKIATISVLHLADMGEKNVTVALRLLVPITVGDDETATNQNSLRVFYFLNADDKVAGTYILSPKMVKEIEKVMLPR